MGRGILDGFAVDALSIFAPGMVSSWGLGKLDLAVEGFGIGDFGLAGGFVVNGVG